MFICKHTIYVYLQILFIYLDPQGLCAWLSGMSSWRITTCGAPWCWWHHHRGGRRGWSWFCFSEVRIAVFLLPAEITFPSQVFVSVCPYFFHVGPAVQATPVFLGTLFYCSQRLFLFHYSMTAFSILGVCGIPAESFYFILIIFHMFVKKVAFP